MSDELFDALRNILVLLWFCFLIAGIFVSGTSFGSEKLELEVRAFRLQQFEVSGRLYGSKTWKVLNEAVSINGSVLRKCMVVHWTSLRDANFDLLFSAPVGAVLVIIPNNLTKLSEAEKRLFLMLEQKFATVLTELAIYFAPDSRQLRILLKSVELSSGKKAPSATQQLINSMIADNYQISSSNTATTNVVNNKIYNIISYLNAVERGRPFLFIVAHYDTYGIIPALSVGSDANGSGIAVLLELLAVFSQLYLLPSYKARYNLVFVLSSGGRFSYQGSRSFIDDFNEQHSGEAINMAICLDSLSLGESLYVHASKMPTEGNALHFINTLKSFGNRPVTVVTKKINLVADNWHGNMKFTIFGVFMRSLFHTSIIILILTGKLLYFFDLGSGDSLLDLPSSLNLTTLEANTKLIASALVAFVFGLDSQLCYNAKENNLDCSLLNEASGVNAKRLHAWQTMFGSKPRPIVIPQQRLVSNLHEVVKRYAHSSHISEVNVNDFVLYGIIEDTLTADVVKPAIFELILAAVICSYLYGLYYIALNAQSFLEGTVAWIRKNNDGTKVLQE